MILGQYLEGPDVPHLSLSLEDALPPVLENNYKGKAGRKVLLLKLASGAIYLISLQHATSKKGDGEDLEALLVWKQSISDGIQSALVDKISNMQGKLDAAMKWLEKSRLESTLKLKGEEVLSLLRESQGKVEAEIKILQEIIAKLSQSK